jgi:hypothetical protein
LDHSYLPPFVATSRSTTSAFSELVKKTDESFLPSLTELPGFSGYSLIEAGNGVVSSVSYFDHLGAR